MLEEDRQVSLYDVSQDDSTRQSIGRAVIQSAAFSISNSRALYSAHSVLGAICLEALQDPIGQRHAARASTSPGPKAIGHRLNRLGFRLDGEPGGDPFMESLRDRAAAE